MQSTADKTIVAVGSAALFSPAWLPTLHTLSATAAEWTPILGGIVLILTAALRVAQIARELRR